MRLPVHLTFALLLAACTPEPTLMLGVGEADFTEVNDGDEVLIVQGPQDGYHFDGALMAFDVDPGNPDDLGDPSNPTITFAVSEGGTQHASLTFTQGLKPTDDETVHQLLARRVILDIQDDSELDGHDVEFMVEVKFSDGTVLSDTHTVHAVPHPLNGTLY